ncbi:MAG: DNA polymerase III subunit gamma/tau [bacterium]|nr:DNA polymerase III subunit gamma/tau [bacterium]MDZ4296463.1 DNA polymerase III subunit gamma/tau [Patescibacteria group bacterium]
MVIYRKYRPKSFGEVTGQTHVVGALQNAIRMGRVGHAYLFTGPRGTGKTTLARIFAKTLNCERQESRTQKVEPCNACHNCTEVNEGRSLDLVEIDAASHRGIDEVRELREGIKFAPLKARYKVFVIDESHQLTKDAVNAFLKTLEEPPAHAVFILATTEPEKMLQTILSRVVRFDFRRLTGKEMRERLEYIGKAEEALLAPEIVGLIIDEAEGSLRDAESLLEKVLSLGAAPTVEAVEEALGALSFPKVQALASAMIERNSGGAIVTLHKLIESGVDPRIIVKGLVQYFRKTVLLGVLPEARATIGPELSDVQLQTMLEEASRQPQPFYLRVIERLLWAADAMRWSPYPIIPLEMVILELGGAKP